MDLNKLYFDHQILLMRAELAVSSDARRDEEVAASRLAGRIGCMQRALGAGAAPVWEALAALNYPSLAAPARHQQGHAQ